MEIGRLGGNSEGEGVEVIDLAAKQRREWETAEGERAAIVAELLRFIPEVNEPSERREGPTASRAEES